MASNVSRPSHPEPDESAHLRGRRIEERLHQFLLSEWRGGNLQLFSQPDAFAIDSAGRPFLIESKGLDYFEAPPFDGHGLPIAQLRRYEAIREASSLRTLFMVWDQLGLCMQWLDALERGPHHDTPGTIKTPRRIYPLTSFHRRPVHGAEHGAPTDEPPAPAPYDSDMDAALASWMDTLGEPLPDHQHAAKNLCPKCGEPGAFYAVVDRKYCWPCFNKQASRANA